MRHLFFLVSHALCSWAPFSAWCLYTTPVLWHQVWQLLKNYWRFNPKQDRYKEVFEFTWVTSIKPPATSDSHTGNKNNLKYDRCKKTWAKTAFSSCPGWVSYTLQQDLMCFCIRIFICIWGCEMDCDCKLHMISNLCMNSGLLSILSMRLSFEAALKTRRRKKAQLQLILKQNLSLMFRSMSNSYTKFICETSTEWIQAQNWSCLCFWIWITVWVSDWICNLIFEICNWKLELKFEFESTILILVEQGRSWLYSPFVLTQVGSWPLCIQTAGYIKPPQQYWRWTHSCMHVRLHLQSMRHHLMVFNVANAIQLPTVDKFRCSDLPCGNSQNTPQVATTDKSSTLALFRNKISQKNCT